MHWRWSSVLCLRSRSPHLCDARCEPGSRVCGAALVCRQQVGRRPASVVQSNCWSYWELVGTAARPGGGRPRSSLPLPPLPARRCNLRVASAPPASSSAGWRSAAPAPSPPPPGPQPPLLPRACRRPCGAPRLLLPPAWPAFGPARWCSACPCAPSPRRQPPSRMSRPPSLPPPRRWASLLGALSSCALALHWSRRP